MIISKKFNFLKFLFITLAILLTMGVGYFHFHQQKISNASDRTMSDTISDSDTKTHPDEELQELVNYWANRQSVISTVVIQELNGKLRNASAHSTESVVPASTYKIYVAYGVLHDIELGKYTLNTTTNDGNTIQTDLDNMILNSDNNAGRTLGFLVGWQTLDDLLRTEGIASTNLNNYKGSDTIPVGDKHTTSNDLATFLDKLYDETILNKSDTHMLLGLMEQQNYRERIPAGVPVGITVADKPGWLTGDDEPNTLVQNDAAIVYGPKSTYVLVITTDGSDTQPLTDLSRQLYAYLEN